MSTDVLKKFPQVEEAEVARRQTHQAHPRGKGPIAIENASTVESSRAPQGEVAERVKPQRRPPRPREKGEVVIAKIETS